MSKAQPLKDMGQFFEGMVRNTVGKMTGIAQSEQASRERQAASQKKQGTAVYQKYKAADIEAFSKMGGQLTEKTEAELSEAKPVSYTETKDVRHKGWMQRGGQYREKLRKDVEQEYNEMAQGQRDRIQGLYNKSMTRLGAIRQSRLRPGARKQSLITRKY
tara:strand:- start:4035 stop:4514 length:480 start_codon:yes stop_codon:yes gene_type:complete